MSVRDCYNLHVIHKEHISETLQKKIHLKMVDSSSQKCDLDIHSSAGIWGDSKAFRARGVVRLGQPVSISLEGESLNI